MHPLVACRPYNEGQKSLGTHILSRSLFQLIHVSSDDWITFHQLPVVVSCVSDVIQLQVDKFANCGKVCDPRRIVSYVMVEAINMWGARVCSPHQL